MACIAKFRSFLCKDTSGVMTSDLVLLLSVVIIAGFSAVWTVTSPLEDGAKQVDRKVAVATSYIREARAARNKGGIN